jgi:hypothetical protein
MSNLIVGQVIEVEVATSEVYGLFCKWNSVSIFIDILSISWIASFNSATQIAAPGDRLTVLVTNVSDDERENRASLRDRYSNPWPEGLLREGRVHSAKIIRYVEQSDRCANRSAYLLEIVPGGYAMLCENSLQLTAGETHRVIIVESTPSCSAVRIKSAP